MSPAAPGRDNLSRRACTAALLGCLLVGAAPLAAQAPAPVLGYLADSSLQILAPFVGAWRPVLPDSVLAQLGFQPIANHYEWTVGGQALRVREGYRADGAADESQLDGLVYWNPATEKIEFVAVAGHGAGQGRLFQGEYRARTDGTIEREYHVYYRSGADTPGEAFGGLRRRFLETMKLITPDSMETTLHWWHDGAWRPFGRFATGQQVRHTPRG